MTNDPLKRRAIEYQSRNGIECWGTDILFGTEDPSYLPHKRMMRFVCENGGHLLLHFPLDSSRHVSSLKNHLRMELLYYPIGGLLCGCERVSSFQDNASYIVHSVSDNDPLQDCALEKDCWIMLWNLDRSACFDVTYETSSKNRYTDVTSVVLPKLIDSNDLVVLSGHDGAPVRFFGSAQAEGVIDGSINAARSAILSTEYWKDNKDKLTWDEVDMSWCS